MRIRSELIKYFLYAICKIFYAIPKPRLGFNQIDLLFLSNLVA